MNKQKVSSKKAIIPKTKNINYLNRTSCYNMVSYNPYRFGFNGKENDNEVYGTIGTFQDYGMRYYDTRVGRFISSDPLTKSYPWYTPYQFAGNKPICAIDIDGLEDYVVIRTYENEKFQTTTLIKVPDDAKLIDQSTGNLLKGTVYIEIDNTTEELQKLQFVFPNFNADANPKPIRDASWNNLLNKENNEIAFGNLEQSLRPLENDLNNRIKGGATVTNSLFLSHFRKANVFFDSGKFDIRDDAKSTLDGIATIGVRHSSSIKFLLIGNTDSDGSESSNITLGINRARAVYNYLVDKGVNMNAIKRTLGESSPAASNSTQEGKQENRRVDIEYIFPKKGE